MSITVGFIGLGNMGSAMVRGLSGHNARLCGTDLSSKLMQSLADETGLEPMAGPAEVASASDYLVLAIKPHQVRSMLENVLPALNERTVLVSVAAGLSRARLAAYTDHKCPVVRVMPNTPALVGAGAYALCLDDERLSPAQKEFLQELFGAIGKVFVLPEDKFDAYTAVVGSGPAYVMYAMEALVDASVYLGLTRPEATAMVETLFLGTAKLAAQSELHLTELKEMVVSPGGTTARGLAELEKAAVKAAVLKAAVAACERSKELGD